MFIHTQERIRIHTQGFVCTCLHICLCTRAQVIEEQNKRLNAQSDPDQPDEFMGVSMDRMLMLSISGPTYCSLDLVDLPGWCQVPKSEEEEFMPQQTGALLEKFVKLHEQHSFFLVVCAHALCTYAWARAA